MVRGRPGGSEIARQSRASRHPTATPDRDPPAAGRSTPHSKPANGRIQTRSIRFVFAVLLLTPYSLRFVRGNNARVCAVASALTRSKRQWTEENRTAVSGQLPVSGQRAHGRGPEHMAQAHKVQRASCHNAQRAERESARRTVPRVRLLLRVYVAWRSTCAAFHVARGEHHHARPTRYGRTVKREMTRATCVIVASDRGASHKPWVPTQ